LEQARHDERELVNDFAVAHLQKVRALKADAGVSESEPQFVTPDLCVLFSIDGTDVGSPQAPLTRGAVGDHGDVGVGTACQQSTGPNRLVVRMCGNDQHSSSDDGRRQVRDRRAVTR